MWSHICCARSIACDFDACAAVDSCAGAIFSFDVRKNGMVSITAVLCVSEALSGECGCSRVFIFERGSAVDAVLSVFVCVFEFGFGFVFEESDLVDDFLYAFFGFGVVVVVEFEAECEAVDAVHGVGGEDAGVV